MASELALATMLLIGAGLLMQSLLRLQKVSLGFRSDHLLTFQLSPAPSKYPGPIKAWAFYKGFLDSLRTVPGVRDAALSSGLPLGGGNYTTTPAGPIGKSALPVGTTIPVDWRIVSPDYFRTMDIPFLRGRTFTDQDGPTAPRVMIVSQAMAQHFWGADDPLGRTVGAGGRDFTVDSIVLHINWHGATLQFFSVNRPSGPVTHEARSDGQKPDIWA